MVTESHFGSQQFDDIDHCRGQHHVDHFVHLGDDRVVGNLRQLVMKQMVGVGLLLRLVRLRKRNHERIGFFELLDILFRDFGGNQSDSPLLNDLAIFENRDDVLVFADLDQRMQRIQRIDRGKVANKIAASVLCFDQAEDFQLLEQKKVFVAPENLDVEEAVVRALQAAAPASPERSGTSP